MLYDTIVMLTVIFPSVVILNALASNQLLGKSFNPPVGQVKQVGPQRYYYNIKLVT
jgi:hypothetical protein